MTQITTPLPDEIVAALDTVALQLRRSRTEVIREALEYYLADFAELSDAILILQNRQDLIVDWESAKHELLNQD